MKTIVCFGDSNTWGHNPETMERFPADVRWPGILRRELGTGYLVIEEGQCGRTTVWDDPVEEYKNGKAYLYPCLETHSPIDLVIIMLGTNDLKPRFSVGAFDIAESAGLLADIVRQSSRGPAKGAPRVLVACPAPITETGPFQEMFRGGAEKSRTLHAQFERMGRERGVPVFYVDEVAASSSVDGIHLPPEGHAAIGTALASRVRSLIG